MGSAVKSNGKTVGVDQEVGRRANLETVRPELDISEGQNPRPAQRFGGKEDRLLRGDSGANFASGSIEGVARARGPGPDGGSFNLRPCATHAIQSGEPARL